MDDSGDELGGRGGGETEVDGPIDRKPLPPAVTNCYQVEVPLDAPLVDNFGKWATAEERSQSPGDWEYFLLPRNAQEGDLQFELIQEVGYSYLHASCLDDAGCNGGTSEPGQPSPRHAVLRYQFQQPSSGYVSVVCQDVSSFEGLRFNAWAGMENMALEVYVEEPQTRIEDSEAFLCGSVNLTQGVQTFEVPWNQCYQKERETELPRLFNHKALFALDFVITTSDAELIEAENEQVKLTPYDVYLDQVTFY